MKGGMPADCMKIFLQEMTVTTTKFQTEREERTIEKL